MQCERCNAELPPNAIECPECGAPAPQNIEGFDNTIEIQHILKTIMEKHGSILINDPTQFVSTLNDYLNGYEKERRLLVNAMRAGVLKNMVKEEKTNREYALLSAKSYMIDELFVSENAAEFVLACFTYTLGWPYKSSMTKSEEDKKEEAKKEEKVDNEPKLRIDDKIFKTSDAGRHRLARNIVIPEGFTKIDSFCFDRFTFMRSITLPSTMMGIGDYAFSECKNLKGIELPAGLKVIEQGAFSQCGKLAMIKIPKGILEIPDNTFEFCSNLTVVEIPNTVSSIGVEAFSGCEKLEKLFLPDSVKFIDKNAFSYCPSLTIRCYVNSYVHKYCITYGIDCETVAVGVGLKQKPQ
ncbi:MAG: leucine-rich repeat domain-containing protein [Ruminococcus sp.]|uniref:leucine-rich repeat domain-containing protein n=1 Tax=Ruminococcus sp. TaxID=41978 RepID=UPI0025EFBD8C|nr:leucine-rich repeat domain-containing protein [Ruminococcus sp.]MCR5540784.1 leucine-rich repeat domain-containing protein [Ruminococcus sp.]